jgi:hypothetical protein
MPFVKPFPVNGATCWKAASLTADNPLKGRQLSISQEAHEPFLSQYQIDISVSPSIGHPTFGLTKGACVYIVNRYNATTWQCTCADFQFFGTACKDTAGLQKSYLNYDHPERDRELFDFN